MNLKQTGGSRPHFGHREPDAFDQKADIECLLSLQRFLPHRNPIRQTCGKTPVSYTARNLSRILTVIKFDPEACLFVRTLQKEAF